jgi:hypothetical protein
MAAHRKVLPNFLVIGSEKCGTTWLYFCLKEHPEIFMPFIKEIHYFDKYYDSGNEWYERYFRSWSGQKAIGEVNPGYLYGERTAERIWRDLPEAQLIVVCRNPIERAYSRYKHSVEKNGLDKSFEEMLSGNDLWIEKGRYHSHLQRYLSHFPSHQILVLVYEDLIVDPVGQLRKLFRFIGVREDFVPESTTKRILPQRLAMPVYDKLSRASLFLRKNIRLGWLIDKIKQSKFLHHFDSLMKQNGYRSAHTKRISKFKIYPMQNETRAMLRNIFNEDNRRLGEYLGRDLSFWN